MKRWKKYTSLLLVLILCLSMAACGGKDGNEAEVNYEENISDDGEISIMWDDGETDEAVTSGKTLCLSSTSETLVNPW